MITFRRILQPLFVVLLIACAARENHKAEPREEIALPSPEATEEPQRRLNIGNKEPVPDAPPGKTNWNELAKLLSGSETGPRGNSPAVIRHRAEMKDFWARIFKENMEPIARWRKKNIPSSAAGRNVLYPLSGADFLNAYAFYPDAKEYLLIALEPPGRPPQLENLAEVQLERGLTAVRNGIWTLAKTNYLQSRIMKAEFDNPYMTGTLPAFLVMLGGLGHTVLDVREVAIGDGGSLVQSAEAPKAEVKGVQIDFKDGTDGVKKSLIYLQIRLSASSAGNVTPTGKFLNSLSQRNTLLKSAVYLLHYETVTWDKLKPVHDLIIDRSAVVVQDDSGIPYRSFQDGKWNEYLFGTYVHALPVGGIPNPPQQPDLAAAYKKGATPLDFAYGYGVLRGGKNQSNLMLFVRK